MLKLRRNTECTISPTLGRRELLQAGLGSTASLLSGLAINWNAAFAAQKVETDGKRAPDHQVIARPVPALRKMKRSANTSSSMELKKPRTIKCSRRARKSSSRKAALLEFDHGRNS